MDMGEPDPRRALEASQRLYVCLQAQQWNQVLELLHNVPAPLRVTLPLVNEITEQCNHPQLPSQGQNNG